MVTAKRPRARGTKLLCALAVACLGPLAAPAGGSAALTAVERPYVPGEVLVKFAPGAPVAARLGALSRHDATTKDNLPIPGVRLIDIADGETVAEAIEELGAEDAIEFAEPNYIYRAEAIPDDPRFGSLWGLHNSGQSVAGASGKPDADIDAPEAWDVTTGSDSVLVAVLDTGVAYDHPDLAPNIHLNPGESGAGRESNGEDDDGNGYVDDVYGWDFVDGDNAPLDFNRHGTHVAGTIGAAGNNDYGVTGVSWDVGLIPVRVLGAGGSGSVAKIAAGMQYAVDRGARIVNASLGGPESGTMKSVIDGAPQTLFVAAAGNSHANNDQKPQYPCALTSPNVVCVAATDQNDALADFSNWGASSVDLAAPGTSVLSAALEYDSPIFSEGFEGDLDWITAGANDSWGLSTAHKVAGSSSLADSPAGNYLDNTNSTARAPTTFSLAGQHGCRFDYRLRLDTQPPKGDKYFDTFRAEASQSGTWSVLTLWFGSTEGTFASISEDLSAYDGRNAVGVGFGLMSDDSIVADGAYVDEVKVRCLSDAYDAGSFTYLQGTSMAAPHVSGAAALLLSDDPSLSAEALKQRLLENVDPVAALAGKTVTGGRLNAAAALRPPAPAPPPAPPAVPPAQGPAPATPTTALRKAVTPDAACAKARGAVVRAKRRLGAARKALRTASGRQRLAKARRQKARAQKSLGSAQARQRKSCKR